MRKLFPNQVMQVYR